MREEAPASSALRGDTLELSRNAMDGPWVLEVGDAHGVKCAQLEHGERLVIGSSKRADIHVRDRTVSARHAVVEARAGEVEVRDAGSTNGVYIGGAKIGSAVLSAAPCHFVIGRATLTLRAGSDLKHEELDDEPIPNLIGSSLPMRRLANQVRRVAPYDVPVLLLGESGTGKDLVARAIHGLSHRQGRYVPLNVAAIAESLADAELFGHRRGAFTGAVAARPGAFEEAHGGTLFLDEIGDLSPSVQAKLLRAVENGEVRPVGSAQPIQVDVRTISATWLSLEQRIASGAFRNDLYHRISTLIVEVPALRDRKSDIPQLARALLEKMEKQVGRKALSSAGLARLVEYDFPGNVRELSSVLTRAAALGKGSRIDASHVEMALPKVDQGKAPALSREQTLRLLSEHDGNISAAARSARVARSTFRAWVARAERGGA